MKMIVTRQLWLTADKESVVTGGPTKGYRWKRAGDEVTAEEAMRYGLSEGVHYHILGGPAPRRQAFIETPQHDLPTTASEPIEGES
jgi:hypothetical protein